MKIEFPKPTLYVSHSIRGDGTKTMEENCKYACRVADKIERVFPEISLYVPARSDLSLQVLWNAKKISVDDIMYADLKILRACHGWMWVYTGDSKGCIQEWSVAVKNGLTKDSHLATREIIQTELLKANFSEVRRLISPIVEAAKSRFRKGNE
jgi:hypothetical protein